MRYLIRTDGFAFLDENLCKKLDDLTDDIAEESKKIKGVMIIKPSVSMDIRGSIWTSFLKDEIDKLL